MMDMSSCINNSQLRRSSRLNSKENTTENIKNVKIRTPVKRSRRISIEHNSNQTMEFDDLVKSDESSKGMLIRIQIFLSIVPSRKSCNYVLPKARVTVRCRFREAFPICLLSVPRPKGQACLRKMAQCSGFFVSPIDLI